jgi:probable HAF family extracellular repeat protein
MNLQYLLLFSLITFRATIIFAEHPFYKIIDLGTLGSTSGDPFYTASYDINNSGLVVGHSFTSNNIRHAFVWNIEQGMKDLENIDIRYLSSANEINNNGFIIGSRGHSPDISGADDHTIIWDSNGNMQDIGLALMSEGINDNGNVIGYNNITGKNFIWDNSNGMVTFDFHLGGGGTHVYSINNYQQIVGESKDINQNRRAFFWDSTSGIINIGTLGTWSAAGKINNNGQVIGNSSINNNLRAFIWDEFNGIRMIDNLGGKWSLASDINDHGQIVGTSETVNGKSHAFIWDAINGTIDLNEYLNTNAGWELTSAQAINDHHQIVGLGINPSSEVRAFILIPLQYTLTIKVEPNDIGINTTTPIPGDYLYYSNVPINIYADKYLFCPDVYQFYHWEGEVDNPNAANTTTYLATDKTITAIFTPRRECGDECHNNNVFGDYNHDCIIDIVDFSEFASNWLSCTKPACD